MTTQHIFIKTTNLIGTETGLRDRTMYNLDALEETHHICLYFEDNFEFVTTSYFIGFLQDSICKFETKENLFRNIDIIATDLIYDCCIDAITYLFLKKQ